ncbi:hypothetical protein [Microseira wollei]|uniref:hypothetical protein n=1 Tax=Microseira wollei TaxID=467598 RepID=UPI001CFC8004|nr:hypothetical protein [Microseira wollei]
MTQVIKLANPILLLAPLINLREISQRNGSSMLECRNTIVEANKLGKFPNCMLESSAIYSSKIVVRLG